MAQPVQAMMHPVQDPNLPPVQINGSSPETKLQIQPTPSFPALPSPRTPAPSGHTPTHDGAKVHPSSSAGNSTKANRLSKACDYCSKRKVKCDEQGPPCRACRALDLPCTFERPSRRRGPPNKHAEAVKRQRMEPPDRHDPHSNLPSSSSYPITQAHSQTYGTFGLDAASICPIELVELLVDDFYTYVQPIKPFPHEPWFRDRFSRRDDVRDPKFLALLAAVVGSLVASYPRRPQKHLKRLKLEHLFSSSLEFVNKCQSIVFECRGSGYLQRNDLGIYDAATSYFLMAMNAHTYRMVERELHLGESLNIIRSLGYHRPSDPMKLPVNKIELETGRRIYWTIFVTVRTATAFSDDSSVPDTLIPPQTLTRPHPPLPAEVDDHYIHQDAIQQQPKGVVSRMAGFNTKIRIYLAYDPWIAMDLAYGMHQSLDRGRQINVLMECLENVKKSFQAMPSQFVVWPGPPSNSSSGNTPTFSMQEDFPGGYVDFKPNIAFSQESPRESVVGPRQITAYEIQKAGIHAAYLTSRSYFAEKLWSVSYGMRTATETTATNGQWGAMTCGDRMRIERNSIADELLAMLSSIQPMHLEPNAFPFCMQIRQIASTLLPAASPVGQVSAAQGASLSPDDAAAQYIRRFMHILMNIEKGGMHGQASRDKSRVTPHEAEVEEEEELRRWADLRHNQKEFAQRSGIRA